MRCPQPSRFARAARWLHRCHCCCSRHWKCLWQRRVSDICKQFHARYILDAGFRMSDLSCLLTTPQSNKQASSVLFSMPRLWNSELKSWVFFFYRLISVFDFEDEFANRSVGTQGGFQAAGTCVAVAFGLVGGAIVGEFIVHKEFWSSSL